jgi:hypothetical protein
MRSLTIVTVSMDIAGPLAAENVATKAAAEMIIERIIEASSIPSVSRPMTGARSSGRAAHSATTICRCDNIGWRDCWLVKIGHELPAHRALDG